MGPTRRWLARLLPDGAQVPASAPPGEEASLREALERTQAELVALRELTSTLQLDVLENELAVLEARNQELARSNAELIAQREVLSHEVRAATANSPEELVERLKLVEQAEKHRAAQLERADVVRQDMFHELSAARAEARALAQENQRLRSVLETTRDELSLRARQRFSRLWTVLGFR